MADGKLVDECEEQLMALIFLFQNVENGKKFKKDFNIWYFFHLHSVFWSQTQVIFQILKTKLPSINLTLSSTAVPIIFLSFNCMVWLPQLHINQHKGHLLHHSTSDAGLVIYAGKGQRHIVWDI